VVQASRLQISLQYATDAASQNCSRFVRCQLSLVAAFCCKSLVMSLRMFPWHSLSRSLEVSLALALAGSVREGVSLGRNC
jgi:hypothetical protein